MSEDLDFGVERPDQPVPGVSYPVIVSVAVHVVFAIFLINSYHPVSSGDQAAPIARYIQLIKQNPKDFVEAPGPKTDKARVDALWSDANRHASAPNPTGEKPTMMPGDGNSRIFTPPTGPQASSPRPAAPQQHPAPPQSAETAVPHPEETSKLPDDITNPNGRMPALQTQASAANVNWNSAIKEVGKVASLGGGQNLDLSKIGGQGGEKGFVEQGPLSFETQWYDWGEYAQSMVSKIRINWYDNMPELIRTGMKGVVTIRFTIQRDGSITDVTILNTSSVPPYDNAAQKAIELSSKLKPLPKDFPMPSERVTCMFFYNMEPPR